MSDEDEDEDEDELLFPTAPRRASPNSSSSIYAAADAGKHAAQRELLALKQRLDAEPEQFRVWTTERDAEARDTESAVPLVTTALGERYYAGRGLTLSRMSPETVQLTCCAYPMAPATCKSSRARCAALPAPSPSWHARRHRRLTLACTVWLCDYVCT